MDEKRRTGLEQEFLLVDDSGEAAERSDELLSRRAEIAAGEGLAPENFSEECSLGMIEVKTSPVESLEDLEEGYLASVRLALRAGRDLGLYPLALIRCRSPRRFGKVRATSYRYRPSGRSAF